MITPDLLARITRELAEVFDDVPYLVPAAAEVVRSVLIDVASELHGDARTRESCTKVDDCTAEAIVLRALADWVTGMAKEMGK